MSNFTQFETVVQHFSNPKDFEKNRNKLKDIDVQSYETFIKILKLGCEIENATRVCKELYELSKTTALSEKELICTLNKARFINALIDERQF